MDKRVRALLRRELAGYFQSPVAYVVAVVFLGASAALFFSTFFLVQRLEMRQFFSLLPLLLALLMPALAMRLVAEERRRGTWEVLATLPVGMVRIVAAKFCALWITGAALLVPTLVFVFSVQLLGRLDPGPVIGGYLGAVLLAGVYGAVGLWASAISRTETVALVTGSVVTLVLALAEFFLVLLPGGVVPVVQYAGTTYHFSGFTRGVVDSRSLVYFFSLILFFLVLAHHRLVRER
ncbi:ABC-2 type transport system permease protein [Alkalispirochaeta americana]|uniref:ABC-2 type transport system permease protein n=1 Tax=Alkalispirochaeta americana TaxID=159291 RepID=A0A1N6RW01_9SPIO|nr:ABC transporter permease [Alkalispirochaeta americana]SIQ33015.1 ABC-2 type transport system permease protein [Alkalispirochaeta americana]